MQLLFGETTLRIAWMRKRTAAKHWNSRQRESLSILATKPVPPASIFSKMSGFPKFRCHGHRCVAPYNCFISQRPDLILRKNKTQHMFATSPRWFHEIKLVQHRKPTWRSQKYRSHDRRSSRNRPCWCNYSSVQPLYESLEWESAPPQGIEIRASEKIWAH